MVKASVCVTLTVMKGDERDFAGRLFDEEIKHSSGESELSRDSGVDAAAFSGAGAKQQKKKKSVKWKCFGCDREGHKIADCPEKRNNEERKESKKTSMQCTQCGQLQAITGEVDVMKFPIVFSGSSKRPSCEMDTGRR
ncbi:AAEL004535-PA [Aedes aegypti]|uniref:AAEL004535-PA n=1 Tax=Aedes aegypti TaxID=7159 RepID=Q17CM4_AEDAE|nr:AAEL004535-PA [Aedes aegypti]